MYLFIDCETTGLPRNWKAPVTDIENWPRTIQIAWAEFDRNERHVATKCFLVRPDGFTIPREAQRIHGISTAEAMKSGKPAREVLEGLGEAAERSEILVAHNVSFDEAVITAEFIRLGLVAPFSGRKRICTMKEATEFCGLPGPHGYKWPTLQELCGILFGEAPADCHDAETDVMTCAKCFFELKKRRVLRVGR